jgi:hypothetical protein
MATPYTVKPGDTLSAIARSHSMTWQDLYNHPDNAAFRRKRPNPNLIYPGDIVMVPDNLPGRSISYNVPLIPQTTVMGCWAAGVAMILGWRDRMSIDPSTIARNPGGAPYLAQLQAGLDPNDVFILRRWGLVVRAPQSYTVEGFAQLLERHGPLWVAARLPIIPAHIRVVTGMEVGPNPTATRVYINDPWEEGMRIFHWPNRGARYVRTYTQFVAEVENLARAEMQEPAPVYVAHLPGF